MRLATRTMELVKKSNIMAPDSGCQTSTARCYKEMSVLLRLCI